MTELYNKATPYTGMQFFDNNGKPLSHGLVYAYQAGGYQKQNLWATYATKSQDTTDIPNPFVLDENGRMKPTWPDSINMTVGYPYHFVVKSKDGVVMQHLDNAFIPQVQPGKNISFASRDFSVDTVTINSDTTDPLVDQGDPYVFTVTSNTNSVFDGTLGNDYTVTLIQSRHATNPVVIWNNSSKRFEFRFDGAYQVETNLVFNAISGWSSNVTVFGQSFTRSIDTGPVITTYDTTYGNPVNQLSTTNSYVISGLQGEGLTFGYYALAAGDTNSYSLSGTITITRIGEKFKQAASPPVTSFVGVPGTGSAPLFVTFTDTSSNSPTSWAWTFGDGSTSTLQNPTHTYLEPGIMDVSLIATNRFGSGSPYIQPVTVLSAPPPGEIVLFSFETTLTDMATVNTIDRSFAVTAGQTIVCCTQGLTGTMTSSDTYIRLYDETNGEVASNDDANPPHDTPNGLASYLSYVATSTGTYRFAVGGYATSYVIGIAGYQVT